MPITEANIVDKTVKAVIRMAPEVFLRLMGMDVDPSKLTLRDTAINPPEFHSDTVIWIPGRLKRDRRAILMENQLNPRRALVSNWLLKKYTLQVQYDVPVILLVIYLRRGDYRTFPAEDIVKWGDLTTESHFSILLLWEYLDRIRSGEFPELLPLMPMLEERPRRQVLEETRDLIKASRVKRKVKAELLGMAAAIGLKYFTPELVREVFKEEMVMLKQAGFIQDWLVEREDKGRTEGLTEGEANEARKLAIRALVRRFGSISEPLSNRIAAASREWCETLLDQVFDGKPIEELINL